MPKKETTFDAYTILLLAERNIRKLIKNAVACETSCWRINYNSIFLVAR